jgi:hypothetical protein
MTLRLIREEGGPEEMVAPVERTSMLTEVAVKELAEQAPVRRFTDDEGTVWTAEVKLPRSTAWGSDVRMAPMILFWSEKRACLATVRPSAGLGELTTEELRSHLQSCLRG